MGYGSIGSTPRLGSHDCYPPPPNPVNTTPAMTPPHHHHHHWRPQSPPSTHLFEIIHWPRRRWDASRSHSSRLQSPSSVSPGLSPSAALLPPPVPLPPPPVGPHDATLATSTSLQLMRNGNPTFKTRLRAPGCRSSTSAPCSRTRRAHCTWGICGYTPSQTCSRGSGGCRGSM